MKKKFEDNLDELKQIADKLEAGSIELGEALLLYEKGMKIVKECEKQLSDAETAVKMIST